MSQRSYTGVGTLILGGLAAVVGCTTMTPAEEVNAARQRFQEQGYVLLTKEEYENLTNQEKINTRLEAAVDARLQVLTGIANIGSAATAFTFYQRMEESRRRAEMAVVEARTFQQRTGTQFNELQTATRDPIERYGQNIRDLRTRMGEFQVALDVQAQIMDGIWRRYESFNQFYVTTTQELQRGLEANYQETQRIMSSADTPLPRRIEQWRAQAQTRHTLRTLARDHIDARAEADISQSRADVDNLLLKLAVSPQRP